MASKTDIIKLIYEQCNKSIDLFDITNVINIIINNCIQEILEDQIITVGNFGTLTKYIKRSGYLFNVNTKKWFNYKKNASIKFYASDSFNKIAKERVDFFLDLKEEAKKKINPLDKRRKKK